LAHQLGPALERYDDASRLIRRRLSRRASPRDQRWLERATAGRGAPAA